MIFIADPGSSHLGNENAVYAAVDDLANIGVPVVKFQLWEKGNPEISSTNYHLDWDVFETARSLGKTKGIEVTASVFDEEALDFLISLEPRVIKLAYSRRDRIQWIEKILMSGIIPIVSTNVMEVRSLPKECIKLFCISQYPVTHQIDLHNLFFVSDDIRPPFDGFSDHTLGFKVARELIAPNVSKCRYIEKHWRPNGQFSCPDDQFAMPHSEWAFLMDYYCNLIDEASERFLSSKA